MTIPFDPAVYPHFSYGERVRVKRFGNCPGLVQAYIPETGGYMVTVLRADLPEAEQSSIKGALKFIECLPEELVKL